MTFTQSKITNAHHIRHPLCESRSVLAFNVALFCSQAMNASLEIWQIQRELKRGEMVQVRRRRDSCPGGRKEKYRLSTLLMVLKLKGGGRQKER